jgi:hypothetical protein
MEFWVLLMKMRANMPGWIPVFMGCRADVTRVQGSIRLLDGRAVIARDRLRPSFETADRQVSANAVSQRLPERAAFPDAALDNMSDMIG